MSYYLPALLGSGPSLSSHALEVISWMLQEIRRFCDAHNLTIDGYPMQEFAAHPQAAQVMKLFHDLWGVVEEPIPTTGVTLATRDDWRELLETFRSLGTSTLWFAFHGADEIHDRAVLRKGACRHQRVVEAAMTPGSPIKTVNHLTMFISGTILKNVRQ